MSVKSNELDALTGKLVENSDELGRLRDKLSKLLTRLDRQSITFDFTTFWG
jgi:hypothetical protein